MSGIKSHKKAQAHARRQARSQGYGTSGERRRDPGASSRRATAQTTRRPQRSGERRASGSAPRRSAPKRQRVTRTIRPSVKDRLIKKLPFIGAAVAALLLIWGGITLKHWVNLHDYDKSKIATTVKIGPVDVSGMTQKQAMKEVKNFVKKSRKKKVTIALDNGSAEVTLQDLGLTADHKKDLAAQALAYGSSGSVNKRYKRLKALEEGPYTIPLKLHLDADVAKEFIQEQCEPYEDGPRNAMIELDGDKIKTVEGKSGMVVDTKDTITKIEKKLNDNWDGQDIVVKVASHKAEPEVSKEDLKGMKDVLGSYETSFAGSDEGRATNIEVGVSMINGTVVQPGETFSTDGAMRPYTEERGWAAAGSYENGDVVDTLGGGICQISTTLYNAVLYAELEVVQRQPHSMRVNYVDPGRDAAIADDVKDFKFRNNSENPVYIYGHVEDEKVTFTLYGKETRPKDRKVEFSSEVLKTTDFKKAYKASDDAIGKFYISVSGHKGMTAKLWKTVTEGGKKETEEVSKSVYKPQDTIYSVGTSSDSAAARRIVTNAISSQDPGTIRAAIAKARKL